MTSHAVPPDPYDVVAAALECPKESLAWQSSMYQHHGWDSLGHVNIVTAIEHALGISIDDDQILNLTTMKAICEFFDRHSRTNRQ